MQEANHDWASDGLLTRLGDKIAETKSNLKF